MEIIKSNQPIVKKIPGNYYTDLLVGTSSATSSTAIGQNITYVALVIPDTLLVSDIAFNQTTTAVGVSYKCNLYDANSNTLLPNNKLLTSDVTVSADTIGVKSVPINRILKGLYYLAITRSGGASPTLTTKSGISQLGSILSLGTTAGVVTTPNLATRLTTFTFANNLPNPATQDSPNITYLSTAIPMLWYRV